MPLSIKTPMTSRGTSQISAGNARVLEGNQYGHQPKLKSDVSSPNRIADQSSKSIHHPRIIFIEAILLSAIALGSDIIGMILSIAGFAGNYLDDLVYFPLSQLYFLLRKTNGSVLLIGNIISLIPGGKFMFPHTVAMLATIYADHFPDSWIGKKLVKVGEVAGKVKPGPGGAMAKIKTPIRK